MNEKKKHCSEPSPADIEQPVNEKKSFITPTLTKYGTVKDVYRGPSCKSVIGYTDDK